VQYGVHRRGRSQPSPDLRLRTNHTKDVIVCSPNEDVRSVAQRKLERWAKHLPVVEEACRSAPWSLVSSVVRLPSPVIPVASL